MDVSFSCLEVSQRPGMQSATAEYVDIIIIESAPARKLRPTAQSGKQGLAEGHPAPQGGAPRAQPRLGTAQRLDASAHPPRPRCRRAKRTPRPGLRRVQRQHTQPSVPDVRTGGRPSAGRGALGVGRGAPAAWRRAAGQGPGAGGRCGGASRGPAGRWRPARWR